MPEAEWLPYVRQHPDFHLILPEDTAFDSFGKFAVALATAVDCYTVGMTVSVASGETSGLLLTVLSNVLWFS